MWHASPVAYLFIAVYAVLGVFLVRKLRKPTCRVCLYRKGCPHRKSSFADRGGVPCYERESTNSSAASSSVLLPESSPAESGSESP